MIGKDCEMKQLKNVLINNYNLHLNIIKYYQTQT